MEHLCTDAKMRSSYPYFGPFPQGSVQRPRTLLSRETPSQKHPSRSSVVLDVDSQDQGLKDGPQVDPVCKQRLSQSDLHHLHLKRHRGKSAGQRREAFFSLSSVEPNIHIGQPSSQGFVGQDKQVVHILLGTAVNGVNVHVGHHSLLP